MFQKRGASRIKTSVAVAFSSAGDLLCGNIMNISCKGVFIETETVLPVDTELALRISFPHDLEIMDIAGRVAWAKQASDKSPAGVGIEFVGISFENKRKINSFVESCLAERQKGHACNIADEAALL